MGKELGDKARVRWRGLQPQERGKSPARSPHTTAGPGQGPEASGPGAEETPLRTRSTQAESAGQAVYGQSDTRESQPQI